ncbi:hypothetical protein SCA6_010757 [Theobroma cacao]
MLMSIKNCFSGIWKRVCNYIRFSKSVIFISGTAGQVASLKSFLCDRFRSTLDIDETETMKDEFSQKQEMEKYEDTLENRANFWKNIYCSVFRNLRIFDIWIKPFVGKKPSWFH